MLTRYNGLGSGRTQCAKRRVSVLAVGATPDLIEQGDAGYNELLGLGQG